MKTLVIHHDDCLRHDPGPRHAERADRIGAVLKAVSGMPGIELLPAPKATPEQLQRVHPADYWERLCSLEPEPNPAVGPASERVALDPDTWLSPGSLSAALRGRNQGRDVVARLLAGR